MKDDDIKVVKVEHKAGVVCVDDDGKVIRGSEQVDHPPHYNQGKFEVIDVIEDWGLDFHMGNCIKYIARARHKENELKDLQKALWYLERYIRINFPIHKMGG